MGQGVTHSHDHDETASGVINLDVGANLATALKAVMAAVRGHLPPPLAEQFALDVTPPEFPEVPASNDFLEALLPHLVPLVRFLRDVGVPEDHIRVVVMEALEPYLAHDGDLRAVHGEVAPASRSAADEDDDAADTFDGPRPPAAGDDAVRVEAADASDDTLVVRGCGYLRMMRDMGAQDLGAWMTCGLEERICSHQGLRLLSNGQYRGGKTCRFQDVSKAAETSESS